MNLPKDLKNKIKKAIPLAPRTTFRIGGKAQYWYEPTDKKELAYFLKETAGAVPFFVIGAGSNLLIKDGMIKKIFVHLNSNDFKKIEITGSSVVVGAGVKINHLLGTLKFKNLGGYEFLAGIPGTIGGALVMNAGAKTDLSSPPQPRESPLRHPAPASPRPKNSRTLTSWPRMRTTRSRAPSSPTRPTFW